MKKIQYVLVLGSLMTVSVYAQDYHDALRYAQTSNFSTARSTGMAGAFTALGGDFGSLSINPAGVGVYRGNEITFSPSFSSSSVSSKFNGSSMSDFKYTPSLNNLGAVFTFNTGNTDEWISTNLAFGYNKIANYNSKVSTSGVNTTSTMIDNIIRHDFTNNTYGLDGTPLDELDPYYEWPAFETYLMDTISGGNNWYESNVAPPVKQTENRLMRGSLGEYLISFGGNYNNKLYLGLSFSLISGRSEISSDYYEEAINSQNFNEFHFRRTWDDRISGFNFKFGAIYKPTDYLRIGTAIHTPTFYNVEESFDASMSSNMSFGSFSSYPVDVNGYSIGAYNYSYNITTPARYVLGVAGIIKKMFIISADYEYTDYSTMRFEASDYDYNQGGQNPLMEESLQGVSTIRLGGEARFGSVYTRAGYSYSTNPYTNTSFDGSADKNLFSLGLGYRENTFFVDIAYTYQSYRDKQRFYSLPMYAGYDAHYDPKYSNQYSLAQIITTIGFRF